MKKKGRSEGLPRDDTGIEKGQKETRAPRRTWIGFCHAIAFM